MKAITVQKQVPGDSVFTNNLQFLFSPKREKFHKNPVQNITCQNSSDGYGDAHRPGESLHSQTVINHVENNLPEGTSVISSRFYKGNTDNICFNIFHEKSSDNSIDIQYFHKEGEPEVKLSLSLPSGEKFVEHVNLDDKHKLTQVINQFLQTIKQYVYDVQYTSEKMKL